MKMHKRFLRSGSILLMTALASTFILGMTALAIDVGYTYHEQNKLQTAVDSAWKAGFDRMLKLKSTTPGNSLSEPDRESVKLHIREMIQMNGLPKSVADDSVIEIDARLNKLSIKSKYDVGLFFAKIVNVNSMAVYASRDNSAETTTAESAGIAPLAIPHGITKDSLTEYSCAIFGEGEGFLHDRQYIIKLGECIEDDTVSLPQDEDYKMILIPMDDAQKTTYIDKKGRIITNYDSMLRAYGAAFWCLHTGKENDESYTPVEWVLGYRGGSFLLPYSENIITMLQSAQYNVYYEIADMSLLKQIYDAVNAKTYKILELYDRPLVAVYSSQTGADPVEKILITACIPYGPYALPETPDSFERGTFDASRCLAYYDAELMSGVLDKYNWLHLHHEDFTGCGEGCTGYNYSCRDRFYNTTNASGYNTSSEAQAALNSFKSSITKYLCPNCANSLNNNSQVLSYTVYDGFNYWNTTTKYKYVWNLYSSCGFAGKVRCADRVGMGGGRWTEYPSSLCATCNNTVVSQLATSYGYTDDETLTTKYFDIGGGISTDYSTWFGEGSTTGIQKLRFELVNKIRNHVINGGFLYGQCFAPETLDLTLWQKGIYEGKTGSDAFEYCIAFQNMTYDYYPCGSPYSTINTAGIKDAFTMNTAYALEPECQCHTPTAQTSTGKTSSFTNSTIKADVRIYGYYPGKAYCKYIGGDLGKGKFSFMGGHNHTDIASKRLVLNNVLLGSLAEKAIVGKTSAKENKIKYNYGRIDPDNVRNDYDNGEENAAAVSDYIDRLKYGYSQAINLNDRLITESGNLASSTEEAVNYASGSFIIVPITDIGTEAGEYSTIATGTTIYDLKDTDEINLNGLYTKDDSLTGLKVPIRVIGFAKFQIIHPDCYSDFESGDGSDLGAYIPGQIRARFIEYVVHPSDVADKIN
ncbi:MAG: Tad domain-containing protein [Candidatus Riflebacteria bacterium]|nr:Tad domain-containing protein [Candidatus Riflebacteria bacterium]